MSEQEMNRRSFLTNSSLAAGSAAVLATGSTIGGVAAQSAQLRWGILGVGGRSRAHLNACNALDSCVITALCDIDDAALQKGLEQVKGPRPKLYKRYQDMLGAGDVDAVAIVTPNYQHKQQTLDCLAAGKHVLCEKPMGVTLAECDEVVAAIQKSDRVVQYGMQLRHSPTYVKVNELVQGGAIGNIRYAWISDFRVDIRELYPDPVVERTKNWRYFQHTSGGMLLEYSIHRLDLMNWWMNSRPVMLSAFGGHNVWRNRETIDHCGMLVEYANGAKSTYGMSLYSRGFDAPWLLMGDDGQMLVSGGRVVIQKGDVANLIGSPRFPNSDTEVELPRTGNADTLQYEHFVKAVHGEVSAYPGWRIAYDAMWVGIQGEQAIAQHQVFKV